MIPFFDAEQAEALSTEVGWNQTRQDWQRLLELAPDGCFGAVENNRLVATTVALTYDLQLAWIGMVITTAAVRGKGYARELMGKALAFLDERGVRCVKLDATDLGRPVYAKLGFLNERPVSRWLRRPAALETGDRLPWHDGFSDLALDAEAFGVDRSALLARLAEHESFTIPGRGFAFARPGRMANHFGPCVARDEESARALLSAFLEKHAGEPTILDLCDDHEAAVGLATEMGFEPVRRLMRMYRGDPAGAHLASGPLIYTMAGFEYG